MNTCKSFLFVIFWSVSQICLSQVDSSSDSLAATGSYIPEDKLKSDSEWLRNLVISHDSLINLIATKANQEFKNNPNNVYIRFIVSILLDLQEDTTFSIVANNLSIYPYIHQGKLINVLHHKESYPVVEAIERAPQMQQNLFKDYILTSKFLTKPISEEVTGILNYLLIKHDPGFALKVTPDRYSEMARQNIRSILDWKKK